MRIENKPLLAEFRGAGRCSWCGKNVSRLEPHHYFFSRGAGGSDVRINLVGLCSVFGGGDDCHHMAHNTREIRRCDLLAVVAVREGLRQDEIEEALYGLRNHPKHLPLPEWLRRFVQ